MDPIELTKMAVEQASGDEELKEKIKDLTITIGMSIKDAQDDSFTFSVDKGQIKFLPGLAEDLNFKFEISKKDYSDLMTGEQAGMILMATGKLKMLKGSWAEINKVATPLVSIPKIAKEIAEKEKGVGSV